MVNLQDYIVDSKLFKTVWVDDLLFVEYRCLVDSDQSPIWTSNNYLAYVLGGEKKWKTSGDEYKVGAGEALFVRKGAHTVYQYFNEPFVVLFIFIPDDFIRSIVSRYPDKNVTAAARLADPGHLIPLQKNNVLETFFKSLLAHFGSEVVQSSEVIRLKLEELVLNILTQPENQPLKRFFFRLGHRLHIDLKEVMESNFFQPLEIKDYARICGRSLASFRRDFHRTFGVSPGQWLITKRLQYGRFLIETTDEQINAVVERSGFKNRSHFTRAFKKMYGISPNQHRLQGELL